MGDAFSHIKHTMGGLTVPGWGVLPNNKKDPRDRKIILLGPDCSGKSTIAKHLASKYEVSAIGNRRINHDLDAAQHVIQFVRESVIGDTNFVMDQFMYPVDIVYNEALRGEASIMELVEPLILPYLNGHNVLFLHIDATDEELERRYDIRGDELWTASQIRTVANAYREYFKEMYTQMHYRYLNTTTLSIDEANQRAYEIVENFYGWEAK